MDEQQVLALLKKYKEGTLSPGEKARLETWYINQASKSQSKLTREEADETLQNIRGKLPLKHAKVVKLWPYTRYVVVASVLLAVSVGCYLLLHKPHNTQSDQNKLYVHDISPGRNGAILTLSNGQQVVLNQVHTGKVAQQGNTNLQKTGNSLLIYKNSNPAQNAPLAYNTLTTPRGMQFKVILPDGTLVYLNAASGLRYPVAFTGTERKVELTGEAYFEVTKNKAMPFIVHTAKGDIQVLGTHFNVAAYSDEANMKTTLLEGSVKISQPGKNITKFLKPDQEAVLTDIGINVINVDAEDAVAWKDGIFLFNNDHLDEIMKKISRWYNVDVQFNDEGLKKEAYSGTVSRFALASEVLGKLEELGGVSFRIEPHKIIVMRK